MPVQVVGLAPGGVFEIGVRLELPCASLHRLFALFAPFAPFAQGRSYPRPAGDLAEACNEPRAWPGSSVQGACRDQLDRSGDAAAALHRRGDGDRVGLRNGGCLSNHSGPRGSPIYTWSGAVRAILGLKEAIDAASMKALLAEWIDQKNAMAPTSDKLPPSETTDGQPKAEAFPFHPAANFNKAGWDELRKARLNLFCFPQGSESLNCLALRQGIEEIGLWQFPG